MAIADYDAARPAPALSPVHTLCHAPFTVMDLGPQGQVTTCNHFHRFIGNLHRDTWLDIFRGEEWTRLRQNMLHYRISELDCRHCSRQIRSGHPGNTFAQEHFDSHPAQTATPRYPTVIIFRLSNVCNLKCVMCNGTLSHRIRKEREKLPPLDPPPYDERFFREMEETLPNVGYVEFYGGEPFLVKEHLRILDIIEKTRSQAGIYANTNGTVITDRIKGYIERLNFVSIAVSIDALYEDIHERIRVGIEHDKTMSALQWLLDLRKRKKIWIGLNTTETRFNWYHLPVMYDWAARHEVYIHINTCLHPSDTTLYDLPTEELAYVADFFARQREILGAKLAVKGNHRSYSHLEAMVRDELGARRECRKRPNPYPTGREPMYGGFMSVPELRRPPIATAADARVEIARVQRFEAWDYALRMARSWLEALGGGEWAGLRSELEALATRAEPLAEEFARRRGSDEHRRLVRVGWKLDQEGNFTELLASLAGIAPGSEHFAEAELLRARALRRMKRFEEARPILERLRVQLQDDPAALVEQAWFCFDTGDVENGRAFARGARSLTDAGGERSQIAAWAHALGLLAVRAGDRGEALEALRALEQVQPCTEATKQLRDAVERIDEVRAGLAIHCAWSHAAAGEFTEALVALAGIPADSPLAYEADMPRARILRQIGRAAEAKAMLECAVCARPDRPEAHVELAWLACDTVDLEAALAHAHRARALAGGPPTWAHVLAVVAIASGHGAEAAEALGRLHAEATFGLPASPGGTEAAERERTTIASAWAHEARAEYVECERCVGSISANSPRAREALVIRARVQRRRGDVAAALRTLALSIAIEPVQLEALIELAWLCRDIQDVESGLAYARRARALSEANENPLGVVVWAHALGLLAALRGDEAAVADTLSRLHAVVASEAGASAAFREIEQCAVRNVANSVS